MSQISNSELLHKNNFKKGSKDIKAKIKKNNILVSIRICLEQRHHLNENNFSCLFLNTMIVTIEQFEYKYWFTAYFLASQLFILYTAARMFTNLFHIINNSCLKIFSTPQHCSKTLQVFMLFWTSCQHLTSRYFSLKPGLSSFSWKSGSSWPHHAHPLPW